MGTNSKLFLIYGGLGEPYIVGAVLADSIREAAFSIGGELELRKKREAIVWVPEKDFFEMWKGKRYQAGKTPESVEDGFENLLWCINPNDILRLGPVSALRSLKKKEYFLGFIIKEISLLPKKIKRQLCLDGVSPCIPKGGPECAGCGG